MPASSIHAVRRGGWLIALVASAVTAGQPANPLPSWNTGPARQAIVSFVSRVVTDGGPDYVAPADRIAVFDNDGTLWCEQPVYVQLAFMLDRVNALAPSHPDWQTTEPFASVLTGDIKGALSAGEPGLMRLLAATHTGMTSDEFDRIVRDWIATARHPKTGRLYTQMVYQPMLELLTYLRANDFKTFIVSGGGIDFMRPWTERTYGIPPEQVVGSTGQLKFEMRSGQPVLVRLASVDLVDDKDGKPVGIQRFIGRHPILAFGNSDGDLQMLQWTAAGTGPRFLGLVHHTDAVREYAYDRQSPIGALDKALDEATARQWTVVSVKDDWKTIFPQ